MAYNNTDTSLKENNDTKITSEITNYGGKQKPKLLVIINTILCFMVIIMASSALILNICGREILIEKTIEKSIERVDEKALSAFIFTYIEDSRIEQENIDNILVEIDVMEFINKNIRSYSNYLLDGEELQPLTAEVVIEFIEDNKEIIRRETGLKYVESDKEQIRKDIEQPLDDFNAKLESNITVINSIFSLPFMILMIVILVLVFAQWCFVYVKNSIPIMNLFKLYGIAVFIPSFLFGIMALFLKPILGLALPDKYSFVADVTNELRGTVLLNVGIFIIIGLAMIVISIIIKKITQAIKSKKSFEPQTINNASIEKDKIVNYAEVRNNQVIHETVQNTAESNMGGQVESDEFSSEKDIEKKYKFCTECGNKLMENAVFCAKCGKKMN